MHPPLILLLLVVVLAGPTLVMVVLGWHSGLSGQSSGASSLRRALLISVPLCWSFCDPGTLESGIGPSWLVAILTFVKCHNFGLIRPVLTGISMPVLAFIGADALGRRRTSKARTSASNSP